MNTLSILDHSIHITDGLYSLNDLHKAAGGENKHRPKYFLENQQTVNLIKEIEQGRNSAFEEKSDTYVKPVNMVHGGVNPGTYAAWISPKFHLAVIQAFLAQQMQPVLPDFTNPAEAARAWADQHEKRAKLACEKAALEYQTQALNNLIEIDKPKVEFYEQVTGSSATVSMATVAKVLNVPGYGRNRLFAFLREKKVLNRQNAPFQRYVDLGWFRQVETKFQKPDGETCINVKTVVFQRGVDGIRRLLEKKTADHGEVPCIQ